MATVMGLENVLDHTEGFVTRFDRERGRDPGLYYLRVFGEPGGRAPWGWRFGGHHVSLHNLVVDGRLVATTPCFLGADPASSTLLGGVTLRPLAAVEDLARALVRSLAPSLAGRAVLLPRAPSDIVAGNRPRTAAGDPLIPLAGVWRAPFTDGAEQATLQELSDAIETATGFDGADHHRLALTAAPRGVAASEFQPHYYRLQGPRLLVEFDNTQRRANHAHSVWRDPEADFGLDVLAAHRVAHHR